MKQNLGCFNLTGLFAAVVVLVLAGAAGLLTGGSLFSPGGLNATSGAALGGVTSHAGLGGNCSACHTPPFSAEMMNDRCLACHQDVAAQINSPTGLHSPKMIKDPTEPCRDCHTEHHGPTASLTKTRLTATMHDQFGFSLKAHTKLQDGTPFNCKDCHTSGYASFDQAICSTCHTQIDAAAMQAHVAAYSTNCTACHDGIDSYGKAFDHNTAAFKLTGKHISLDCYACHKGDVKLADMKSTPTQCVACHQAKDIHNGSFGQDCGACHKTDAWSDVTFDHSKTSFPLTGAHLSLACTSCHINNVFKGTPTQCVSCHADPAYHAGLFGTDCASCHSTTAWSPAAFNGPHQFPTNHGRANSCQSCHPTTLTNYTCYSCHDQAQTATRHSEEGITDLSNCFRCHSSGRGGG